jgi:peptidoglycan/LPS O-acetylase OafA/YrhL
MLNAKQKLPSIEGLRAISIILVLINHLAIKNSIFVGLEQYNWLTDILQDGQLGVNVFFVISGFLITSLLLTEEEKSGKISLKQFFTRRMLRIFPAYYFLLLVYFCFQLVDFIQLSQASWITSITYTKYFNWQLDWFTAHFWSLSIEEHFYLIWPFAFVFAKNQRKKIALFLFFLVPFVRLTTYFYPINWLNDFSLFARVDAIAIGCLFALYKDQILQKISQHWRSIFYFSILVLILIRYFPWLTHLIGLGTYYFSIALGATHGTIANVCIALIMMYSIYGPQKMWFSFLNTRIMRFIGVLSYSIYLWQQFFISGSNHWYTSPPLNLLLILFTALFSYYFIEKPFLRLKQKFSSTK